MNISIIIPVYHEEKNIEKVLQTIDRKVKNTHEILVIYDSSSDPTVPVIKQYQQLHKKKAIRLIKNKFKKGVMHAIKTGFEEAKGNAFVVVMADLADDMAQIDVMYELILSGADIICASRFIKGGKKIGGPLVKTLLTRTANFLLYYVARLPIHDSTNAYKMYKRTIFKDISIESTGGFEYSLEVVLKAFKKGYKLKEIPTVWKDRTAGSSNFQLRKWLPQYVRWFLLAFR
jgi:dolichol-phosphate mannosyltransferase